MSAHSKKKSIKKEHVWLGFLTASPLTAFLAFFYPAASILAVVFLVIGIKGVMAHVFE